MCYSICAIVYAVNMLLLLLLYDMLVVFCPSMPGLCLVFVKFSRYWDCHIALLSEQRDRHEADDRCACGAGSLWGNPDGNSPALIQR